MSQIVVEQAGTAAGAKNLDLAQMRCQLTRVERKINKVLDNKVGTRRAKHADRTEETAKLGPEKDEECM